jgi:hypothetical protein
VVCDEIKEDGRLGMRHSVTRDRNSQLKIWSLSACNLSLGGGQTNASFCCADQAKVGTNIADKRRLLDRYSSLSRLLFCFCSSFKGVWDEFRAELVDDCRHSNEQVSEFVSLFSEIWLKDTSFHGFHKENLYV